MTKTEKLVMNLNPKAKLPRGFMFWDEKLIIAWLKSNQKKAK
jgi:hypothetical protein